MGLVEMTCGLVHASYSLPEWQVVKLTFFAPGTTALLIHFSQYPLPSKIALLIKEIKLMDFSYGDGEWGRAGFQSSALRVMKVCYM